jgi:adenine phosphoribosyltransferase
VDDMNLEELKKTIREVPNFPKNGILFYDMTTLLKDGEALKYAVKEMKKKCLGKNIDVIVGIESRGFIFGGILAHELGVGFVPVRKLGKLPAEKIKEEYGLEYGKDCIEIHKDAIESGQNVLICDDLLATAGTALATAKLIEKLGGNIVGMVFLMELSFLRGREKLSKYDVSSLIQYDK